MSGGAWHLLPAALLERGTLRGAEHAWPVEDIPDVIEVARVANLVNIGGQLQFRLPDGGTCECYWIEVDTFRSVRSDLPWPEQVEAAAAAALSQFRNLQVRYDFLREGREAFAQHLARFEASGGDPSEAMCFVWYLKAEEGNVH